MHDSPVRQRQQGRDAAQFARRACAERARGGRRLRRRRRAGHHGAPARRSAAHHAGRRARRSRGRCAGARPAIEYNIEGDPRPELLELVEEVRPDQCTLVPVVPGEITSQAGWQPGPATERLPAVIARLARRGSPRQPVRRRRRPSRFAGRRRSAPTASSSTPSRSRARSSAGPTPAARSFAPYAEAARLAHCARARRQRRPRPRPRQLLLFRELPLLDEVSIGHAIMSRALFVGLSTVVREYLEVLAGAATVDYDQLTSTVARLSAARSP